MAALLIWSLVFSISYSIQVDGLVCLQCKSITSPRICKRVTQCGSGEVCKVQRLTNEFGEMVFDLGCSPSIVCSNVTAVSQHSSCTQCCDIDLCNHVGCNEEDYPVNRGPICYNCQNPTPAERCHDIEFCAQDQICKVVARNVFGDTLYTRSCELQHTCRLQQRPAGIIGKRESAKSRSSEIVHACDTCCSGDLCNKDCQQDASKTAGRCQVDHVEVDKWLRLRPRQKNVFSL